MSLLMGWWLPDPSLGDAGVGAGGAEELLDRSHSRRRAVAALQRVAVLP